MDKLALKLYNLYMNQRSVALIGSFHESLAEMKDAIDTFTTNGIEVVNPLGTEPLDPDAQFVRFESDKVTHSPEEIEALALMRILGASAVYVVCPDGYVGKTTSYEFGWAEGAKRPIYFSHYPKTEFMQRRAEGRIVSAAKLAELIITNQTVPLKDLLSRSSSTSRQS